MAGDFDGHLVPRLLTFPAVAGITLFRTIPRRPRYPRAPPPGTPPPPPPEKEFQAYKTKKYIYLMSNRKYTYNDAAYFCLDKGAFGAGSSVSAQIVEGLDDAPSLLPPSPPQPTFDTEDPFVISSLFPGTEKEFQAYKTKKYIYLMSNRKYTYNDAAYFCLDKGYDLIPYDDKTQKDAYRVVLDHVPADATNRLCYESGRGCWVGGQQGNYCAYVDPDGNGGSSSTRYCDEEQYAVCFTKAPLKRAAM
ncbi:hypothetical protein VOLCADRAFT_90720 [Volvox carteri f. nagariensis]|uniref:C-type lectin domain-containing protein n=1 Tax=Volvox carteri f. nagariensis TaxID=3068 RepID=D8TVJ6_VOLCA|nr:uncharacterized protein VOLCADRAFT_90720 [Volvox carteri f. nagariensis]EFJ48592.1 hypothetical protein VOLCADRAFT_90720 [Volvox carteri f. nagariensis]|eukprot:XP_002950391.1 hypothetical protein VOLCADRAFT_90720 [Volvox carteri f. nagariensis]